MNEKPHEILKLYNQWKLWFDGDDRNSISEQIVRMIWDTGVFKMICDARQFTAKNEKGNLKINWAVHRLIDKCYFESQAAAIRRLLDQQNNPRYEVMSLYKLVESLEKYQYLLTRENLFYTRPNIAYDYSEIRKQHDKYLDEHLKPGEAICIPEELNWERSEGFHKDIDMLAGSKPDARRSDDAIRKEVFPHLKNKLDTAKNIVTYVDKFIAHAESKESRASDKADDISITWGHLEECQKAICEVASFISIFLFRTSRGYLAYPQFNLFKYLDEPIITSDQITQMRKCWNDYDEETKKWGSWTVSKLINEIDQEI